MRKWFIGFLLAFILAVAVPAGIIWNIIARGDDGSAELRAKGYPASIEELEAWFPEPPPGENAAELYMQAGRLLGKSDFEGLAFVPIFGGVPFPAHGTELAGGNHSFLGEFIEHEFDAYSIIDRAYRCESSHFPDVHRAFSRNSSPLPRLESDAEGLGTAFTGIRLRMLYHSGNGDVEEVLDQIAQLVHLARVRLHDRTIHGITMYRWEAGYALRAVERLINTSPLTDAQSKRLETLARSLSVEDGLTRAFVAERCLMLAMIDEIELPPIPRLTELTRRSYGRSANFYITLAEDGLPARLEDYKRGGNRRPSPLDVYAHVIDAPFFHAFTKINELKARITAATLVIAIQRERAEGAPPPDEIPKSLKTDWPIDPFSGQPFRYARLDEGFMVYSIGTNTIDNGGNFEQNVDIGFRVLQ